MTVEFRVLGWNFRGWVRGELPSRWLGLHCSWLGPPVVPFYPFFGAGSPAKIDYRKKKWYPYSNLSLSGGPSLGGLDFTVLGMFLF